MTRSIASLLVLAILLLHASLLPASGKSRSLRSRQAGLARAMTLVRRAAAAYDKKQFTDCIGLCKQAANAYTTYARAYVWMGAAYQKLGNRKEAIFNFKWALALSPDTVDAARSRRGLQELGYYTH